MAEDSQVLAFKQVSLVIQLPSPTDHSSVFMCTQGSKQSFPGLSGLVPTTPSKVDFVIYHPKQCTPEPKKGVIIKKYAGTSSTVSLPLDKSSYMITQGLDCIW